MQNLVPFFILEQFAAGERHGLFPACALFVDITGFSRITDTLMEHGQHGAEVLATVMNRVFEPLVQSVYEQGGFITHYAGDAFTAVFPDSPRQALAAARNCQQHMARHQEYNSDYGRFHISARAGAALGEVAWGIVSSKDQRRAGYYFRGSAIDGCVAAEKEAQAGHVILEATLYERVKSMISATEVGDHWRVKAVIGPLPKPIEPHPDLVAGAAPLDPDFERLSHRVKAAADIELAARFFPRSVIESDSMGEFRRIVSLFINLPTVRTEAQLAIFMQTVFTLQERYGGYLNRLDFGDKGANLLLFWGAPIAYENDVQRTLNFILDLQSQTAIPINGGVTYRIAHAGHIGSALRSEYTTYGRGINLAARFMTQAPRGEIWLDEYAAKRAEEQFDLDYDGEIAFKGFAQPQKVYVLFERKETAEKLYTTRFIGRERELAQLANFVAPIFTVQNAGLLIISGEAGIGKSRLVHDFLEEYRPPDSAQDSDFAVFLAQTDEILRRSLNPFRYWLKRYFSVSDAIASARNKRSFNRKLDGLIARTDDEKLAAELDHKRSFLGALADLEWPDSLYEQLDAKSRREFTLNALIALLQAESRRQPLIFHWEDIHWADEDSRAFLPRLLNNLAGYPVAILATARPESEALPLEGLTIQEIDLSGLTSAALAALTKEQLGGAAGDDLLALLAERAAGNPFFVEQILQYLLQEEMLVERSGTWHMRATNQEVLPVDVQAMLIARLDRLAQSIRDVVQTAAILGREFEVRLLSRMLQDDQNLPAKVAQAEHEAIWSALTEIRYIFRHALLRDAAYRMQLRARRQALHGLALRSLESLFAANPQAHYGEMAYHALAAGLSEPAFSYSLEAGDGAMQIYALPDALSHYQDARRLLLDGQVGQVDAVTIEHLFLQLGRVLELSQDYAAAKEIYEQLAAQAAEHGDRRLELAALIAQCVIYATHTPLFNPSEAREYGQPAMDLARELHDKAAEARALWAMMLVEFHVAEDFQKVSQYGNQALALARERDLTELIGYLQSTLTWFHINQDQITAARQANAEAESIWQELGNLAMLVDTYTLKYVIQRFAGEFVATRETTAKTIRLSKAISNPWHHSGTLQNVGYLDALQGQFEAALAKFEEAERVSEEAGHTLYLPGHYNYFADLYFYAGALDKAQLFAAKIDELHDQFYPLFRVVHLGIVIRVKVALQDLQAAKKTLDQAYLYFDETNQTYFSLAPLYLAESYFHLADNNPQTALERTTRLIKRLNRINGRNYLSEALWLQAEAWLALGQQEQALAVLLEAKAVAEAQEERVFLWRILARLSAIERERGNDSTAKKLRVQAQEIITYIADHAGTPELRASFLSQPEIQSL